MASGSLIRGKMAIAAMTILTVIAASPFSPPAADNKIGVSGSLGAYAFKPDYFEVKYVGDATLSDGGVVTDRARKYRVTLSQTDQGRAIHEFQLMIMVGNGETLEKKVFVSHGYPFGTPEFKKERYPNGSGTGRGIVWMQALVTEPPATSLHYLGEWHDGFRGAMSFGPVQHGRIGSRIDLVIPGEHPCRIKGNFVAQVVK